MKGFNLRKFLTENQCTRISKAINGDETWRRYRKEVRPDLPSVMEEENWDSEDEGDIEYWSELIADMIVDRLGMEGIWYSPSTDIYLYVAANEEDLEAQEDAGFPEDQEFPAKVGKLGRIVRDVEAYGNAETAKKFYEDLENGNYRRYKYRSPFKR